MKLHKDVKNPKSVRRFKTLESDFRKIHGNKYDYILVEFMKVSDKVKIICPTHGEFEQRTSDHLKGIGCKKCGIETTSNNKRLTTIEFVEKAKLVHGDKYDYSLVEYKDNKNKVKIICPFHGEFEQLPSNHLLNYGCKKCGDSSKKLNIYEFIEKAKVVHGNKYDYSLVDYKIHDYKVKIICLIHGNFLQTASMHLSGNGCPKCSGNYIPSTEEWIEKAKAVHGDKYDYSLVDYIGAHKKVKIICKEHGVFEQTAGNHLRGAGCLKCSNEYKGWGRDRYKDKRTILYFLKVHTSNQTLYKIGITSRMNVFERYKSELSNCKITILNEIVYEDGALAFDEEQRIIKENKEYRYRGGKVFNDTGTTEMFTINILE